MRKVLVVMAILALAAAAVAQAPADRNANGVGYYVLQVPDPGTMVIDGSDADWSWFDPTYVITMDQLKSEQDAPMPDPADMEVTLKMAFSGQPENMWYLFAKVHDDTLDIESTDVANPWADDCINFGFNPLDTGRQAGDAAAREYYQPYVIKSPRFLTTPEMIIPSRWDGDPATWRDFCRAPLAYGAVTSNPAEAIQYPIWTSDTGVDIFFELKMAMFDWRSPEGPAASTRTTLEAGKFLPILINIEDGDGGWRYDITTRSAAATAAAYFSGATLLGPSDYVSPTAVESSTWGAIKDSFGN